MHLGFGLNAGTLCSSACMIHLPWLFIYSVWLNVWRVPSNSSDYWSSWSAAPGSPCHNNAFPVGLCQFHNNTLMSKLDHVFASQAVGIDWHSVQLFMPVGIHWLFLQFAKWVFMHGLLRLRGERFRVPLILGPWHFRARLQHIGSHFVFCP